MDVRKGFLVGALAAVCGMAHAQQSMDRFGGLNMLEQDDVETQVNVPVRLNNRPINFPDVQPVKVGDEIMVPMRGVFEHMDAEVVWKPLERKVIATRGSTTVVLPIGTPLASVNGVNKVMDHPPFILNGRTMVPLRFLSYTLHAGIIEMDNQVVNIIPNHGAQDLALINKHDH
jgi:hypothetical protein